MIEQIGAVIRTQRQEVGWTLQNLGSHCGLSPAFLSLVERGKVSPSIVSLAEICRALGLSLRDVFEQKPNTRRERTRFVTRSKTQLRLQIGNRPVVYTYLSGSFSMRTVDLLISSLPPGHFYDSDEHPGEEFGYVLEGTLILTIQNEKFVLKSGDSYHFPSDRKHTYATPHDEAAKVLWGSTEKTLEQIHDLFPESSDN